MPKTHQPIRMCVVCRVRAKQHELMRLALVGGEIVKNPKNTRSFYLCQNCQQKDRKILEKALARFSKGAELKGVI